MINGYTEEEWISFLDEDIARIPQNRAFKLKMLSKQTNTLDRMAVFEEEMRLQTKHLYRLRRFAYYKLMLRKYKTRKKDA